MNKFVLILLLTFCISFSFGQNKGNLGYKWNKPDPFINIPGVFKNEDAVAIYNQAGVKNDLNYSIENHFLRRKIRILTNNGLKEYTNLVFRKSLSSNVTTLDARTIKKDGKTIVVNQGDIKFLREFDEEQNAYFDEYRIAVPGAEVGDEVEYIFTTTSNGITFSDDVFLHTDIACIVSRFDLAIGKYIDTEEFSINGMVDPVRKDDGDYKVFTWTMIDLPSVKNQNYSIYAKDLPYIQYNLTRFMIKNWGELYNDLAHEEYDNNRKSRGLERYFNGYKAALDTMDNFDKVSLFVNKINRDVTIMDYNDGENAIRPVMYFIENNKIDLTNLRLFYKYMFYYLNIPFETCFGKNRYSGDLYTDILSVHQITDVFFSFRDKDDLRHYLFLSTSDFKVFVDERPYQLEDSKVICLKKEDPFSNDTPTVQFIKMPHLSPESNFRSINCLYAVNPDWTSANCDTRVSCSGIISIRNRRKWMDQLENNKKEKWVECLKQEEYGKFDLDTVMMEQKETVFPFKFGMRIRTKQMDVISSAGENIHSLKVLIPMKHDIIPTYSYSRITDIYMPYLYIDELTFFVQFPSAVSIINEKDLVKNLSTDAGSFSLNIVKISETVYKISSVYKIKTNILPKEKYKALVDLNEMVDQTKELNVLYKKL